MSVTDYDHPGAPPPYEEWGDGPAAYAPGDGAAAPGGGRIPPQDDAAEQSVLGAMLLSKDAIADVVEVGPRRRLLPPGPRADPRRDHRPLRPRRAGRPDHRRRRSCSGGASSPGSAARPTSTRSRPTSRSRPTPATTPRSSARRRSCAGWSTPAPGSSQIGYAGEGQVDDVVDRRRPRSTRSPTGATSEDYAPLVRHHGRRPRRDRGDRQPRGGPRTASRPASPTSTT